MAVLQWKKANTQIYLTDLYPKGPFWCVISSHLLFAIPFSYLLSFFPPFRPHAFSLAPSHPYLTSVKLPYLTSLPPYLPFYFPFYHPAFQPIITGLSSLLNLSMYLFIYLNLRSWQDFSLSSFSFSECFLSLNSTPRHNSY